MVLDDWLSDNDFCWVMQEEMYSYVTICDDQTTKGKGTVLVEET
jgi:hypothetical protein